MEIRRMKELPRVSVAIITYQHENYVQECLESIVNQQGLFELEIMIFDDHSQDGTLEQVRLFLQRTQLPARWSVELYPSETNLGMVKNLERIVRTCAEKENEFATIIDGDDYWFSPFRVQKHIDFLRGNPQYPFSFNAFLRYSEEEARWSMYQDQSDYPLDFLPAQKLAENNLIGNIGCSFFRAKELAQVPSGLFELFCGDWMLHLVVARGRDIGFIHEPLSVYRINANGIWTGKEDKKKKEILTGAIHDFDRLTQGEYHVGLTRFLAKNGLDEMSTEKEKVDLCIVDDVFPHPGSAFRMEEFLAYIHEFESVKIICTGVGLGVLGKESMRQVYRRFVKKKPDAVEKVVINCGSMENVEAELAYFCFLGNVYVHLAQLEKNGTPFVFELYPGGRFARKSPESDAMLKLVTSSPCFQKVITTQPATTRYLLDNHFCKEEQIEEIFGVVTPEVVLQPYELPKKHYGFEKERLDLVFAAFRYTPHGEDKGYDLFIEVAKRLRRGHDNVYFHVVGGFDESVLDVSELEGRIFFYGKQQGEWFDYFCQDKDAILSPNVPDVLAPGAFDGFPTASCTEAALREVAILATDPLQMNEGRFVQGEEIDILPHEAELWTEKVEYYLQNPAKLRDLAKGSARAVRRIYSVEKQIRPRVALLQQELERARSKRKELTKRLQQFSKLKNVQYKVLGRDGTYEKELQKGSFVTREDFVIRLSLPQENEPFKELQFILAEGMGMILRDVSVTLDGQSLPVSLHNGIECEDTFYFPLSTPQVICTLPKFPTGMKGEVVLNGTLIAQETDVSGIAWELKQAVQRETAMCKLYLSENRKYSEANVVTAACKRLSYKCYLVSIPLQEEMTKAVKFVRFDPVEGMRIKCRLLCAQCDEEAMKLKRTNGTGIGSKKNFEVTDPWYEFELPKALPKRIFIVFEMEEY